MLWGDEADKDKYKAINFNSYVGKDSRFNKSKQLGVLREKIKWWYHYFVIFKIRNTVFALQNVTDVRLLFDEAVARITTMLTFKSA